MGARMFTALLPPDEVVGDLGGLLEPRRDSDDRLRWTRPVGWHVTTSFMGDVDLWRVESLVEHLAITASRAAPFDVGLSGGVAFPSPDRAKVLALAVGLGHDQLAALSGGCRRAGSRAGIEVDGARFVGHLTLARASHGFNATRWLEVLGSLPRWAWRADELCLIESLRRGREYAVVERFALGAPARGALD